MQVQFVGFIAVIVNPFKTEKTGIIVGRMICSIFFTWHIVLTTMRKDEIALI